MVRPVQEIGLHPIQTLSNLDFFTHWLSQYLQNGHGKKVFESLMPPPFPHVLGGGQPHISLFILDLKHGFLLLQWEICCTLFWLQCQSPFFPLRLVLCTTLYWISMGGPAKNPHPHLLHSSDLMAWEEGQPPSRRPFLLLYTEGISHCALQ